MANQLTVLFSAILFWAFTNAILAFPQQEEARYIPEETIRKMEELAKNPPKPPKQLTDVELDSLISEAELEVKAELIMEFENVRQLVENLSIVDVQITQMQELRTELESTVQKWENRWAEIAVANTDSEFVKELRREHLAEIQNLVDDCFAKAKKDVLLSHQQKRFDAIYTQHILLSLQTRTAGRATWERVLGKYLKLTPREIDQLKEATEKASQELLETQEEARKGAANQVIAVLPESKRPFFVELGYDNVESLSWLLRSIRK